MEMVKDRVIQCGPYVLDYGKKTLIMGILNVTPDSFSRGQVFGSGKSCPPCPRDGGVRVRIS